MPPKPCLHPLQQPLPCRDYELKDDTPFYPPAPEALISLRAGPASTFLISVSPAPIRVWPAVVNFFKLTFTWHWLYALWCAGSLHAITHSILILEEGTLTIF